ncbi:DUF4760 domain-containing protein [Acinetobacter baumannii]|uniref:DUF4760 domain-containing protein n=1 Tax=Acinetobacter baumannii TaxID=470 RepID=UPI000DE799C6|nr:DUF4760 domain-containing protein [Acinetobacter baumannii]MCT9291374.1 DUF4760 domain-containing protein [Acinetobacter baumannii]MCX2428800.1 DUF4760 domain-containing protein [Acinetobacter baumannii]MDC4763978.1 DUF4760 domain-containing protein [Acinetobacter baumannii]MDC5303214.1 DUF4760 domain-containing protein [Acinetobacter baumannii]MDC5334439.1 DUF4760 domain-containing protein [Acinetobacter baumannii]
MASRSIAKKSKGRFTFILALSAFLIGLYLITPRLVIGLDLPNWKPADWLMFLQLLVFAISAYFAYSTIASSKETSRERGTLDTILDDNKDLILTESKSIVLNFDEDPYKYLAISAEDFKEKFGRDPCNSLSKLAESPVKNLQKCEIDVRNHLIQVLNRFEFYAVGINSGLLDENLFKRTHCANFIKLWNACSPAITHIRKQTQKSTYFKDLELLAKRWENNPLRENDL